MPLLAILLTAQILSAPSLAEVEALSPEQAGRLLLSGRTHASILSAGRDTWPGGTPSFTDYELVEAARPLSGGCVRRRWTARFESSATAPGESPIYAGVRSQEEVALPVKGSCPEDGYALLNGPCDPAAQPPEPRSGGSGRRHFRLSKRSGAGSLRQCGRHARGPTGCSCMGCDAIVRGRRTVVGP